jgi:hypothetical protein
MADINEYITTKEAAKLKGWHHTTIIRFIELGKVNAIKKGGIYFILHEDTLTLEKGKNGRPPKQRKKDV